MSSVVVNKDFLARAKLRIKLFDEFVRVGHNLTLEKEYVSDLTEVILPDIQDTAFYQEWCKNHDILAVKQPWISKSKTHILPPENGLWLPTEVNRSSVVIATDNYDANTLKDSEVDEEVLEEVKNQQIIERAPHIPPRCHMQSMIGTEIKTFRENMPCVISEMPKQSHMSIKVTTEEKGGVENPSGPIPIPPGSPPKPPSSGIVDPISTTKPNLVENEEKLDEKQKAILKTSTFEKKMLNLVQGPKGATKRARLVPKETLWDLVGPFSGRITQKRENHKLRSILDKATYETVLNLALSIRGTNKFWEFKRVEEMDLDAKLLFRSLDPEQLFVIVGTWVVSASAAMLQINIPYMADWVVLLTDWIRLLTDIDRVMLEVDEANEFARANEPKPRLERQKAVAGN